MRSMCVPAVFGVMLQGVRDLPVGRAARDEREHLDLAWCESGRPAVTLPTIVARGSEHDVDGIAIEPAGGHFAAEFLGGLLRRQGGPVGAGFGHGVVGVSGRDQPSGHGNRCAREATVIAGAVEPFVM